MNGSRRTQPLQWLQKNRKDYLGLWVALDSDRLIASGKSAKQVFDAAMKAGVVAPFIELVIDEEPVPFTGGWLSVTPKDLAPSSSKSGK